MIKKEIPNEWDSEFPSNAAFCLLAYAQSHIFDGPMFVKLAMLSQQKYLQGRSLKKKKTQGKQIPAHFL